LAQTKISTPPPCDRKSLRNTALINVTQLRIQGVDLGVETPPKSFFEKKNHQTPRKFCRSYKIISKHPPLKFLDTPL